MENLSTIFDFPADSSLKLYTGNIFGAIPDSLKDSYILKTAQTLDFSAFIPGDQDLNRWQMLISAGIPVTIANLEAVDGQKIPQYVKIRSKMGETTIIIGIWSEETYGLLDAETAKNWKLQDWKISLREALTENKDGDWIIVVTTGGEKSGQKILDYADYIDLVICLNSTGSNVKPNDTGYLLNLPRKPVLTGFLELKRAGKGITSLGKYRDIPITMNNPPPHPEAKALTDQYFSQWLAELTARRRNLPQPDQVFLGSQYCGKCHLQEYEGWRKSRHADAYARVKNSEPRCLPCHTTGFAYPTGFWDVETTPKLAGVGCEECHKVAKNPPISGAHIAEKVGEYSCRCHTPPHDNNFNYETKKLNILQEHR